MAQDMFLKITGIEGESKDEAHGNEIDVAHWEWQVKQPSSMHAGSGGGAGKATISDLYFEHYIDRASPNLMKYCLTGKHIDEAVLTVREAGGKPLEYLRITMRDVLITLVHPASGNGNDRIRKSVGLSFSKVSQEYQLQNAQGGPGGTITASFDIKANKEA
jgi:type VI secretion system secreted protein Hcp